MVWLKQSFLRVLLRVLQFFLYSFMPKTILVKGKFYHKASTNIEYRDSSLWAQKILSVMERGLYEVFVGQSWLSLSFDT